MLLFLMREMRDLKNKVSPGVNAFRVYTYLVIGWQFLNTPANDMVVFFDNALGGNGEWLPVFLHNMQFMNNKFA